MLSTFLSSGSYQGKEGHVKYRWWTHFILEILDSFVKGCLNLRILPPFSLYPFPILHFSFSFFFLMDINILFTFCIFRMSCYYLIFIITLILIDCFSHMCTHNTGNVDDAQTLRKSFSVLCPLFLPGCTWGDTMGLARCRCPKRHYLLLIFCLYFF